MSGDYLYWRERMDSVATHETSTGTIVECVAPLSGGANVEEIVRIEGSADIISSPFLWLFRGHNYEAAANAIGWLVEKVISDSFEDRDLFTELFSGRQSHSYPPEDEGTPFAAVVIAAHRRADSPQDIKHTAYKIAVEANVQLLALQADLQLPLPPKEN